MKKIIYIILVPLLLLSGSCKKFLDQQPVTSLSTAKFWIKATDVPLGMAGIYDGMQAVSGYAVEWGDARSDNMVADGTGSDQYGVVRNAMTPSMEMTNWSNLYTVISRVNIALKYLPNTTGLIEKDKNHYLAQCYAIRAMMYFYIVRLWGDAPLWTEPFELGQDPAQPRIAAAEIMTKVILPDITKAETLIDESRTVLYEMNAGGILALETDIYMYNKDYAKALVAANRLIGLGGGTRYALAPKAQWKDIFTAPGTTKENIFNIFYDELKDNSGSNGERNTLQIGVAARDALYAIDNRPGDESPVHLRFQAQKASGDVRADLTYDPRLVDRTTHKIGKYFPLTSAVQPFPTNQFVYPIASVANTRWPIYRYADILLLKAEALNKTNDRPGALAIVNQIRARAGLTTPLLIANYNNDLAMETLILDERQIELFAEGKRWFDLQRTGRVLEYVDPKIRKLELRDALPQNGFTDARKILLPISRTVLLANTKLVQNAPWSQ